MYKFIVSPILSSLVLCCLKRPHHSQPPSYTPRKTHTKISCNLSFIIFKFAIHSHSHIRRYTNGAVEKVSLNKSRQLCSRNKTWSSSTRTYVYITWKFLLLHSSWHSYFRPHVIFGICMSDSPTIIITARDQLLLLNS